MNRRFLLTLAFALALPATGFACTREEMQIAKINLLVAVGELESALNLQAPPAMAFLYLEAGEGSVIEFHAEILRQPPLGRNHAAVRAYRKAMAEFNRCAKKRRETTLPPLPT